MFAIFVTAMVLSLFLLCVFDDLFDLPSSSLSDPKDYTKKGTGNRTQAVPEADDPERYFWEDKNKYLQPCDDGRLVRISKRELARVKRQIYSLSQEKKVGRRFMRLVRLKGYIRGLDASISDLNEQKVSLELEIRKIKSRMRVKENRAHSSTACTLRMIDDSLRKPAPNRVLH